LSTRAILFYDLCNNQWVKIKKYNSSMATFSVFLESIYRDGNNGKAFEYFVKRFLKDDPE